MPPRTTTPGRIIAHRGASRVAPENTAAAFRAAAAQGATWAEFDVSLLGDRTPVIHHDGVFGRTATGTGRLLDADRGALADADAGGWFGAGFAGEPLPELGATLDLLDSLSFSANLEIKTHADEASDLADAVAATLKARPWTRERIVVSSFDHHALRLFRDRMPDQPLAVLWPDPPADWVKPVASLDAEAVHCDWRYLDHRVLDEAMERDIAVRVYTINDIRPLAPFRGHGLTGVITDHPPLFLEDPDWRAWAAT